MKGLKEFRRSLNKDRHSAGKPSTSNTVVPNTFTSVKGVVTIQPPKLVIRAIKDYHSNSPHELSFCKGDFFHVITESSSNPEWFEASNPMTNARGLVPAVYFDVLSKSNRAPVSSTAGPGATSPQLPSAPQFRSQPPPSNAYGGRAAGAAMTAKGGGGLYAVVKYNFVAERADELEAKSGESIIVIAQSNFEWFVAKPIGRLGGPGLIPVAFVEIRDLVTGRSIDDIQELIQSGVVPKVEEWKKMTAEYKKNTIPLGRFDFTAQAGGGQAASNSPYGHLASSSATASNDRFNFLSDPRPQPPPKDNLAGAAQFYSNNNHSSSQDDRSSDLLSQLPPGMSPGEPLPTGIVTCATVDSFHFEQGDYWFRIQATHMAGPSSSAPANAPTAPEGEERDLILYRLYEDFYEFQIALLDHFPAEAGRETDQDGHASKRILPLMPGPIDEVDDLITSQRRVDLDQYINELCALPEYIMRSELVRLFFEPRPGDHCTTHPARGTDDNQSAGHLQFKEYEYLAGGVEKRSSDVLLQGNGTQKYAEDQPIGTLLSDQDEDELLQQTRNLSLSSTAEFDLPPHQHQQHHNYAHQPSSSSSPSSSSGIVSAATPVSRNPTTESRTSQSSSTGRKYSSSSNTLHTTLSSSSHQHQHQHQQQHLHHQQQQQQQNTNATSGNPPYHRIKVARRGDHENVVALRMPPSLTFGSLLEKVRERFGPDIQSLFLHHDKDIAIFDDRSLLDWLDNATTNGWKLMLYAS